MRAEVDEHGCFALDIDNAAKSVLVVRHQITPLVYLGRFLDDGDIEGTTWQVPSPRAGARWFHHINSTRKACHAMVMASSSLAEFSMPIALAWALEAAGPRRLRPTARLFASSAT